MPLKLRVLQGTLHGANAAEVLIRKRRFLIGTAEDCHMRCPSESISPHHCEIVAKDQRVYVRDLQTETGTFLNGVRVDSEQPLRPGDHLRLGRLEFEVAFEPTSKPQDAAKQDKVASFVNDLLEEADEEAYAQRISDPSQRAFQIDHDEIAAAKARAEEERLREEEERRKAERRKPKKLPPPPAITSEDSSTGAEEALKKLFDGGMPPGK